MGKRGKRGRRGNGEGTIYERTNGTYAATFTVAGGKRKTLYAKTYKEAQEKLKKALYEHLYEQQQGTLVTAPQQTVAQYLTDWLEHTQKQSVRPRTYERYEEIARLHIIPLLGGHKLHQLSAQHVQAFYTQKLEAGLSALTVISFHNLLHKALDTAVACGSRGPSLRSALQTRTGNRYEARRTSRPEMARHRFGKRDRAGAPGALAHPEQAARQGIRGGRAENSAEPARHHHRPLRAQCLERAPRAPVGRKRAGRCLLARARLRLLHASWHPPQSNQGHARFAEGLLEAGGFARRSLP